MPRNRSLVVSSLRKKGFTEEQGKRDHNFYFLTHQGKRTSIYTKVSRGTSHKEISDVLLSAMSKQTYLTKKQFLDLVDCDLSADGLIKILTEAKRL